MNLIEMISGIFVSLERRGRDGAAEPGAEPVPLRQRGRHLPVQQRIPRRAPVVRIGSGRGGALLRPQQFRIHHLHRLLHKLPQVRSFFLSFLLLRFTDRRAIC